MMVPKLIAPALRQASAELSVTLLRSWQRRFVNREWPYAVQQADGTYRWRYEPCDLEVLAAHLVGDLTLALSSTDSKGKTKWLCLDVDAVGTNILAQLVALRAALADASWPGLLETSRRGGHLWFLLDRAIPAQEARDLLMLALGQVQAVAVQVPTYELYPKTTAPSTLGSAVRLPLGIHQLTNERYPFLDLQGQALAFPTLEEAAMWVVKQPRLSGTALRQRWKTLMAASATSYHVDTNEQTIQSLASLQPPRVGTYSPVIRWVDWQISPLDLLEDLGTDCELKQVGQGYLGWCPFHDDRAADDLGRHGTPSFYVVRDPRHGWSWKCFSTNCSYSWGLMRHSFELFQLLLDMNAKQAILAACERWPGADAYRALTGEPDETK